ncbi:tetratricopeptide repeat protein [Actinoplanes sp. DH11]|uniref:ATP-binding protein n=1 Tax=Actinoplanes sp. DH11 TaxID=2857011 RepID=UPI001E60D246|nr:helix-turn-helix domain-containing protein [Actinoplanes sp. DH11]
MLSKVLAGHRRRVNLTQEDLAGRAGLSVRSIRDLENGRVARPRPSTLGLLADALGLSPGERQRFLGAATAKPAGPRQLPLDVPGFCGRDAELAALDDLLDRADTAVAVATIAGLAGVGKTTLAVHWAHRVADRFPDGQLYADLRGFGPEPAVSDPADVLRAFLEALDVSPARIPAGTDARAALYRDLLSDRRMLVVLDNARDDDQVRPLLPGAGAGVVVVTSRDRLAGLFAVAGARPLTLDVLTGSQARVLLAARVGAGRLAVDPRATTRIVAATAGLPLALTMVAARVAVHPAFPLAAFADDLDVTADLRRVFSWSYGALAEPAAHLFRLLGLHPGPEVTAPAAAALAGRPAGGMTPCLRELARLHLLVEHRPGRFLMHDLVRDYAAAIAEQDRDARERLYRHLLAEAGAAAAALQPQWLTPLPQPAVTPAPEAARRFFAAEHQVLTATVRQAAEQGFDGYAWRLAWCLAAWLTPGGRWVDSAVVQRIALDAARRCGDPLGTATASRMLARAETRLGHLDDAESHLREAYDLYRDLGDLGGQAQTLHNLAEILQMAGRSGEAVTAAGDAVALHRRAGHRDREARSLNALGWLLGLDANYAEAIACCTAALAVQRERGDRNGQGATLDSLAFTYDRLGKPARAAAAAEEAVRLFRESGDRYHEAETLGRLGDIRTAAGEHAAAAHAWRAAVRIFDDLDDPAAAGLRRRLGSAAPAHAGSGS